VRDELPAQAAQGARDGGLAPAGELLQLDRRGQAALGERGQQLGLQRVEGRFHE